MSAEALKSLYGTSRKTEIDLSKKQNDNREAIKVELPSFEEIVKYINNEAEARVKDASKRINVGNIVLPFTINVYVEVLFEAILNPHPLTLNSLAFSDSPLPQTVSNTNFRCAT